MKEVKKKEKGVTNVSWFLIWFSHGYFDNYKGEELKNYDTKGKEDGGKYRLKNENKVGRRFFFFKR